ncbi:MAG: DUF3667 domain-containing protein [Fulvivirga sp.]|nr:DUF3667 domain-containing protein [Fulvivirga sp.]
MKATLEKENKDKNTRPSIFSEVIEAFDIEWKLFYTIRDFTKNPDAVIRSYADGRKEYSNPLKLLLVFGTLYWLITAYLVDWPAIGEVVASGYLDLSHRIFQYDDIDSQYFQNLKRYTAIGFVYFMEYLGLVSMVIALGASVIFYAITRKHGSSFRAIAGFLCYRGALFIILLLIVLPFGHISYWLPLILLLLYNIYIEYFRKNKNLSLVQYFNVSKAKARKYQVLGLLAFTGIATLIGFLAGVIFALLNL